MTSTLLVLMFATYAPGIPAPPSPAAGYISRGEYTNPLLGFSMHLSGKWELRDLTSADSGTSGGVQVNGRTVQKPAMVHFELQSEKVGTVFVSGFRRDLEVDFQNQVDAAFAAIRTRLVVAGPDPVVTEKWKDRQLVIQNHAGIQGETETLLGFESRGYVVIVTMVAYQNQGYRLERARHTLTFSSESPEFPSDLLLRARLSEANGFAFGTTETELTVFRNGSLQYACRFSSWESKRAPGECGRASRTLSGSELASLREFLTGKPIVALEDEYSNDSMSLDYSGSMMILIPRERGGQWVSLSNLGFSGEQNNKLYPPAVRSLVCKIFGLRRLAGVAYDRTTSYGIGPEDKPRDDTWCDKQSLNLD